VKVGVFGGTFDPIHNGHLITAQAVKEIRGLDKIIFIPCHISPHKTDMFTAPDGHRLNMINLALRDVPYFEASSIEIDKQEVSYTVDTLRELKKEYEELELIIGYDNILKFDTWKSPDEIMDIAKLIVLKRKVDTDLSRTMNKYFGMAEFVDTPVIEISATEIRRRVKGNLPINFLVPPQVASYIQENKLYC
jgi:nicotinate-nucleotide adenylyltransferase